MNIAFCMNSGFMMPWIVCITSILENNKTPIDFYILYSHLEDKEIELIKNTIKNYGDQYVLKQIKIASNTFSDLPIFGRAKEAYYRLLLPAVMPKDVERCLYLDWDTVVYKPIDDFYNTSFDSKALVVNEDMGEKILYHKERHSVLKIPLEYKYFNSGVLLFNLQWFRQGFDMNTAYNWIKNNNDKLLFLDQDVLNANFYDKVKYTDGYIYDYLEILVNPLLPNNMMEKVAIVHFLKKPWKYSYNGKNAKYWWKYAKNTYKSEYFKFCIGNFIFTKLVNFMLLFISIDTLKKIKK